VGHSWESPRRKGCDQVLPCIGAAIRSGNHCGARLGAPRCGLSEPQFPSLLFCDPPRCPPARATSTPSYPSPIHKLIVLIPVSESNIVLFFTGFMPPGWARRPISPLPLHPGVRTRTAPFRCPNKESQLPKVPVTCRSRRSLAFFEGLIHGFGRTAWQGPLHHASLSQTERRRRCSVNGTTSQCPSAWIGHPRAIGRRGMPQGEARPDASRSDQAVRSPLLGAPVLSGLSAAYEALSSMVATRNLRSLVSACSS